MGKRNDDRDQLAMSGFLAIRLQHLPIITGTEEYIQRSQKPGRVSNGQRGGAVTVDVCLCSGGGGACADTL